MYKILLTVSLFVLAACDARYEPTPVPTPTPVSSPALALVATQSADPIYYNGVYPRFSDEDPHEWAGIRPGRYPIHGIDISKYQGDIDWPTVRRSGVSFAYIKATEGGDHLDEKFKENWAGAARGGVQRGAYHFYYFCSTAAEQAKWFIKNVPRDSTALPPVLDIEWNLQSKTCPGKPTASFIRSEMTQFIKIVTAYYGRRPLIYTTVDFFADNQIGRIQGADFWLRSVADHPSKTYPRQPWTFWQYTGTGNVRGIEGKVDINAFAGTPSEWNSWVSYLRQ